MKGDNSSQKAEAKWGAGHAGAMWRQGLAELRATIYPESNIAQPVEYGMAGTPTPGQIDRSTRTSDSAEPRPAALDQDKQASPAREEPERHTKPRDIET